MDFLAFAMTDDPPERAKREQKAASTECTPLSIDREKQTGSFKGSSGIYETGLERCPCMDCARRRRPCKHMYRLAAELGLYDIGPLHADAAKIKLTRQEKDVRRSRAFRLADGYPLRTQRAMREALYQWHNGKVYICEDDAMQAPVHDGLFIQIDDPKAILTANTQKRTVEGLLAAGFSFPEDLKSTKKARYGWCLEHPEIPCRIVYPSAVVLKVSADFEPVALQTYTHLNKLLYSEAYDGESPSLTFRFRFQ